MRMRRGNMVRAADMGEEDDDEERQVKKGRGKEKSEKSEWESEKEGTDMYTQQDDPTGCWKYSSHVSGDATTRCDVMRT